jgi:hypothetical protein
MMPIVDKTPVRMPTTITTRRYTPNAPMSNAGLPDDAGLPDTDIVVKLLNGRNAVRIRRKKRISRGMAPTRETIAYFIPAMKSVPQSLISGAGFSPRQPFNVYPSSGRQRRTVAITSTNHCIHFPVTASFA